MRITAPRRILLTLTAVALVLTGCAATEEPAPQGTEPSVTEETTEDIAVVAGSDDYVILYSGREESLVQPLIDLFVEQNRHSGGYSLLRHVGTCGANS